MVDSVLSCRGGSDHGVVWQHTRLFATVLDGGCGRICVVLGR